MIARQKKRKKKLIANCDEKGNVDPCNEDLIMGILDKQRLIIVCRKNLKWPLASNIVINWV